VVVVTYTTRTRRLVRHIHCLYPPFHRRLDQKVFEEFERHHVLDYSNGAELQGMRNDDWEDTKK
jgi:hypothetical protein